MQKTLHIMCPNLACRCVLAVPDAARGRVVRCRQCGCNVRVPATDDKASAAPAKVEDSSDKVG
ncbi:MAG: hypothetical protein HRU76_15555 [Phycisphaeraceae bacterium]|nr:hypothetical protein [Phycisphaerales bacterium]QOJ18918.1 MAG: hypothetical protein HRU76_15555 [Phycisphaeraceae bacterium]